MSAHQQEEEQQQQQQQQQKQSVSTANENIPQQQQQQGEECEKPEKKFRVFVCKICRKQLFTDDNLVAHPPPPNNHPSKFKYRRTPDYYALQLQKEQQEKGLDFNDFGENCTSWFIEPGMEWMGETTEVEGKIMCPKCGTRVGSWKWAGIQCSCGIWHSPGFQVPKSKVDPIYKSK